MIGSDFQLAGVWKKNSQLQLMTNKTKLSTFLSPS